MRPPRTILIVFSLLLTSTSAAQTPTGKHQLETELRQQLETLAKKCDDLGLPNRAAETRAWVPDRAPKRQYIFLPPVAVAETSRTLPDLEKKWQQKFHEIRRTYAQNLFELARTEASGGSPGTAYRWLFEVLRHDPEHAGAKNVIQLPVDSRPRSRQPRVTHSKYGWSRGSWWQIDSQHFQITTNAGQSVGLELASQLEDFHDLWRQVFFDYWSSREWLVNRFAGKPSIAPSERKHQVVLFRDRNEYLKQLTPAEPKIGLTLGYYLKGNQTSYFYAGDETTLSVWYHEAGHQLFQETGSPIQDVGDKWNFWVVEGVAVYLESAVRQDGYFTLGGWDADRLQFVRSRIMGGERPMPTDEFNGLGRETLQQHPDIRKLYTQAAGWTHYLMDGSDTESRDAFIRGVADSYAGRDSPRTYTSLPPLASADFDRLLREFLIVEDEDLRRLPEKIEHRNLSLAGARISADALAKLRGAENLEWLDLAYTATTDAGIEQLGPLPALKRLTLVNTQVTDAAVANLLPPALPCLEELDLSGTAITDQACESLSQLKQLKVLRLAHTKVTNAALEPLSKLVNLEELDLESTAVSQGAIDQLRSRLPKLK